MKIVSSGMQLAASHTSFEQHEVSESLRMWIGERRPDFEGRGAPPRALAGAPAADSVSLSQAGRDAQAGEASAIEDSLEAAEKDPRLMLLRAMIWLLTGEEARVFDAQDVAANSGPDAAGAANAPAEAPPSAPAEPPAAGYGVEYDYHESHTEIEATQFSAQGVVRTADGREIAFSLELSMARSYHEESNVSLRLGDAARPKKDPLVLNFAGTAAELLDQHFAFDLDADGQQESVALLAPGSGFLAFDRNGDGRINDGSELFGAKSGDGFAELAQLDGDRNGWIDEGDAAWSQLAIWHPAAEGDGSLGSLAANGVGALALARVATPFELRDAANASLGSMRSSGVWLGEEGGVGSVQQIDLSV